MSNRVMQWNAGAGQFFREVEKNRPILPGSLADKHSASTDDCQATRYALRLSGFVEQECGKSFRVDYVAPPDIPHSAHTWRSAIKDYVLLCCDWSKNEWS